MTNALFKVEQPANEPVRPYLPGSPEKARLKAKIAELKGRQVEIPLIIGGKEVRTGNMGPCRTPHEHGHALGSYHKAGAAEVAQAIEAARAARPEWARMAWEDRVAIFLKAAELLSGPFRDLLNAATMLCQSKNVFQAEIDAA